MHISWPYRFLKHFSNNREGLTKIAATLSGLLFLAGCGGLHSSSGSSGVTQESTLSKVSCSSASMTGAGADACTVSLTAAAPGGGLAVHLSSSSESVTVPASVMVAANATSAGFMASVASVSTTQTATLSASVGSASSTFALQISPAIFPSDATPTLSVSTSSVNFGDVQTGQSGNQTVILSSTGSAPVTITGTPVTGSSFSVSGVTMPATLNPGQTATLTLQFSSPSVSTFTGVLTIISNSSQGNLVVNMNAVGVAAPNAPVAPAAPAVNQVSCSNASITGAGSDACTVSLTAAAPAGGFAVSLASSNAAVTVPASVMVQSNATNASFTASVAPVTSPQTATLTASANSIAATVGLQLNASTPTLGVNTTSVNFGNVQTGQSATQTITLSSTGTAPVTISSLSVAGSLFTAVGITVPATLNPGQLATVTLQFTSPHVSSFTGVLTIASNSSQGNIVVNMSAAGVATLTVGTVSCTNASMTGSGSDACTVNLTGAAPAGGMAVSLASNNAAVTVPATVTVPASSTSTAFTATVSSVTSSQTATLTGSAGGAFGTFALQLTPALATLSVNATSISFGNISLNNPSTQSITLTSSGSTPVTINSATITGTGYSMSGASFPLKLNAGQTATLSVQFDPTTNGAVTGQLTFSSNSSSGATTAISLTGTGVAYSVALTWDAPTGSGDPVVGYDVYRAVQGSTTYQKINASAVTQTAYTDSTVQVGGAYVYYVTSVDSSGSQSTPSNDSTVDIP